MKFYVRKTSPGEDCPPCEGAARSGHHGKVQLWSIELRDLDELVEFTRKWGWEIVLSYPYELDGPELEMVNDYR